MPTTHTTYFIPTCDIIIFTMTQEDQITFLLRLALAEDLGTGDVTTAPIVPSTLSVEGKLVAKEEGIVAGLDIARLVFQLVDGRIDLISRVADGTRVRQRQPLADVEGPGAGILSAERVALNFVQRMSGIATLTGQFVEAVKGSKAVILDTRKTVPCLRALDKLAVRLGGGENHRFGLYDMVLVKDNHIAAAGSITEAIRRVRHGEGKHLPIEVEVKSMAELREALALQPDRIMLDNMSLEEMRRAVALAAGQVELEASGNVTLDNVSAIAATGVDFISVGALTHSPRALDISLEITG
jgi:nicotinate-nucleotide pyrophosphorylase (carboxylating)